MGKHRLGKLTALAAQRLKSKGRYSDGGGLYLQVSRDGARSWIFRFQLLGRTRDMGLGPCSTVSLSQARNLGAECRLMLLRNEDPIEQRQKLKDAKVFEAASRAKFSTFAEQYIEARRATWRNEKHASQWLRTLQTYAYPTLQNLSVCEIGTNDVMKVLEPIWLVKNETANRVRERIEAILDAAKSRDLRKGENPARWRGHLQNLLARPSKVQTVRHHPALPYQEVPAFLANVRDQPGSSAMALELLILTATRTSEVVGALWNEVDLAKRTWTIPATRIKAGKEHRIPLSEPAVGLLAKLARSRICEFIFPNTKGTKHLSNMALLSLLDRMGRRDITVHGFRSTFRDWTSEQTSFSGEVAEMALAHAIEDKVEAAYRRGDLFDKRKQLMTAWGRYCVSAAPVVLPMRRAS